MAKNVGCVPKELVEKTFGFVIENASLGRPIGSPQGLFLRTREAEIVFIFLEIHTCFRKYKHGTTNRQPAFVFLET